MGKYAQIIGAGIGGLTAAHCLRAKGWKTEVFERTEAFGEVGAGLQLSPNATRILKRLGLLDAVADQAFEPEAACIRDGRTARTFMYAPLRGFCQRAYGAPYLHIYRPALHEILRQGLDINLGQATDPNDAADLCVVATGLRSATATQWNPAQPLRFTGQVAWRGVVEADATLKALIPPHATVWAGPGQHVVTYYIGGNRLNFVAVTEQDDWQEQGWDLPGDVQDLSARFAGWCPQLREMFAAANTVRRWALFDRPPLTTWARGNARLLGDAAHPMLPFLAQGAAQAMEDAWALADDTDGYGANRRRRTAGLQAWAKSNASLYHQSRWLDRLKLQASRTLFRGPQAHALFWKIFSK